ncbi:hypothetical protein C8R47DRAFT_1203195 [Mycena vitilis]|nr:hypothetical protein C8R47DRAFT_1203195 [Mycena vitilis]
MTALLTSADGNWMRNGSDEGKSPADKARGRLSADLRGTAKGLCGEGSDGREAERSRLGTSTVGRESTTRSTENLRDDCLRATAAAAAAAGEGIVLRGMGGCLTGGCNSQEVGNQRANLNMLFEETSLSENEIYVAGGSHNIANAWKRIQGEKLRVVSSRKTAMMRRLMRHADPASLIWGICKCLAVFDISGLLLPPPPVTHALFPPVPPAPSPNLTHLLASNDPPPESEVSSNQNSICHGQDRLKRVESQISFLEAQLHELQTALLQFQRQRDLNATRSRKAFANLNLLYPPFDVFLRSFFARFFSRRRRGKMLTTHLDILAIFVDLGGATPSHPLPSGPRSQ